jgi:2-aminoadipate transaminase
LPKLLSMNPDGVIYMGSFSKILAPGMRLGFVIAPPDLHFKLCQAKQAADLHTPTFTQRIAYETIKDGLLDSTYPDHPRALRQAVRVHAGRAEAPHAGRRDLERARRRHVHLGGAAEGLNSMTILEEAVRRNVAYVPGAPFYAGNPRKNTLRLAS